VLSIVAGMMAERGTEHLSLADVTAAFAATHSAEYDRPISNRFVGGLLRRLGIGMYKSNGIQVLIPGQEGRIAALCTRYGGEIPTVDIAT